MVAAILTALLLLTPLQTAGQVSETRKREFIELLRTLPRKGEFFTDESVKKAGPYLPALFALTEKDIEGYDIYPFGALSRGLCDRKAHRKYAVRHFREIRHPTLKLLWGAMLFGEGAASPEIVRFLRDALRSEGQAKLLSEIEGPGFDDFRRRVLAHPAAKR